MPGQRRLAISRLRVPNLDGVVITAAGNYLSIGAPRHREDTEITRSHHTNQQKQRGKKLKKNLQTRVPGQRRLAISRLRVPDLDGFVHTAAGNFFSIGAPRHGKDPEIVRSQDTNQQKLRGKHLGKKSLKKKTYRFECPVRVDWQSEDCESQILMVPSLLPLAICFPSGLHATEVTLYL